MRAIHTFGFFGGVLRKRGATDDDIAQAFRDYPPMEHPIVRTHPETGRKALFLHPDFIRGIVGMTPGRSKALLKHLYAQAATPEYQCRFQWRMKFDCVLGQPFHTALRRVRLLARSSSDGARLHHRRHAVLICRAEAAHAARGDHVVSSTTLTGVTLNSSDVRRHAAVYAAITGQTPNIDGATWGSRWATRRSTWTTRTIRRAGR